MGHIAPAEANVLSSRKCRSLVLTSFLTILLLSSAIFPPTECLFDERGSSFMRRLKSTSSSDDSPSGSVNKPSLLLLPSSLTSRSSLSVSSTLASSLTTDSSSEEAAAVARLMIIDGGGDESLYDEDDGLLSSDNELRDTDNDEEKLDIRQETDPAEHNTIRHQSDAASTSSTPSSGVVFECVRDTKFVNLGHDLQGAPVTVNVGRCRRTISFQDGAAADVAKKGRSITAKLAKDSKVDAASDSCPRHQAMCHSVKERMERYYTLEGPLEIAVVQECACLAKPTSCVRTSKNITFFPETPYEQTMDVGECHGHCESGNSCKPSRNRTVHVVGPNGSVGVEVIESCQCVSSCYRVTRLDVVRDYTNVTSTGSPRIREIDVGRCVGQCTSSPGYDCVMRSPKFSGNCLMSLYRRQQRCAPVGYMAHYFVDSRGQRRTVLSVTDCSCF